MAIESRYYDYDKNIRIHYRIGGYGNRNLVFLHGFAASHTTWDDILPLFPEDRYRHHLLDLKGFGLSSKPRDGAYSIEDQADVVRGFIRDLGLKEVTLIGHSLGGGVSLRLSLRMLEENDRGPISSMVLMDCAAYPQRLPKFFRRLKMPVVGPLLIRMIPVKTMVERTMATVFHDRSAITPERFERYVRYFRGKGLPYTMRASVKCIRTEKYANIGEEYRKLSIPAQLIWGEYDYVVKPHIGQRLHEDLKGSQLKVIRNCGHNPQEERPVETYTVIDEFLSTL
jgi:pimeloyl-ACP methyl ester carboxylesterase